MIMLINLIRYAKIHHFYSELHRFYNHRKSIFPFVSFFPRRSVKVSPLDTSWENDYSSASQMLFLAQNISIQGIVRNVNSQSLPQIY